MAEGSAGIAAPVRVHVTEAIGHRRAPAETGDALVDALAAHLQRIACEGARAAWCHAPVPEQWRGANPGAHGWRAQVAPDTAHLIHVVEAQGMMVFDDA